MFINNYNTFTTFSRTFEFQVYSMAKILCMQNVYSEIRLYTSYLHVIILNYEVVVKW